MRAAMTLALIMACAAAWAETVETYYIDENGTRHDVTATVVTTYMDDLGTDGETTWYVVNENIFLYGSNEQTHLHGNVNLILADGCELQSAAGSNGPDDGFRGSGNLTLYGQTASTGTLSCGQEGFMNITGDFTVCSGMVSVSGNRYNAIRVANFTMRGGSVSIENKTNNDCGIRATGIVNIYSGSVEAEGTNGIEADIVNIYGGSVTARCNGRNAPESSYGYAIKCSSTFNFYGGNVTAKGDYSYEEGQTRYGIYANGINLSWTSTADWINSTNDDNSDNVICYYTGSGGMNIAPYKPFSDGTTTYTGTLTDEQVEALADKTLQPVVPAFAETGDGTPEYPYTIYNATGWGVFCEALQDNETYNRFIGKTVKLGANISVTQSAGSANHDFCGTFDGQNNTLTFTATATDNYLAPFRYVSGTSETNHAVIQNLDVVTNITATDFRHAAGLIADMSGYVDVTNCNVTANITANKGTNQTQLYPAGLVSQVANGSQLTVSGCTVSGTISADGKYAGGMVGIVQGSANITNSVSSATINSSTDGDGTHGGFVASLVSGRQLTIEGCVFNGKIVTTNGLTTKCGGFLGHNNTGDSTGATITNCLYAPTADPNTVSTGCATFGRNVSSNLISNCYYTTALGDAQGTQAYSITADDYVTTLANAGTVSNNYTTSGLIFYNVGLKYGDVLYAASNDEVSLTLAHQDREGYDFIGYTATAGNLNGSTLTMPDGNVTINAEYTCTAPSELLTVYDGTTTKNTVPAYIFYFDYFTRSQFVIPANDLVEMVGASITSMTFYTTSGNVPYTTESPADVYLMEVNYTSISAYEPKSSATTVYSGLFEIVSTENGGEMTINFSTPFAYQGGNLLVGIENTVNVNEGYKNINFYGQTVTGASISGYNSTSLDNVQPTQRDFIPKTTFGFTPACEPKSLPYAYGFEDPDEFGCWTMLNCDDGSTLSNRSAYQGEYGFGFHWNETPPQYLISPKFEGTTGMHVSFFYKNDSNDWPETFQVGYSTTTKSPNAFVWGEEVTANDQYNWQLYEEFFPEGTKYVAVKLNSNDALYLYLDNFNFEPAFCADEDKCELTFTLTDSYGDGWNDNAIQVFDAATNILLASMSAPNHDLTYTSTTDTYTLGVCDGRELRFEWVSGQWPDECSYTVTDNNGIVVFTGSNVMSEAVNYTIDCSQRFVFLTDGDWNDGSNWSIGVVPEEGSDVIIQADVVIPAGYTAYASDVALEGGSITVGDGGQLIHSNEGVHAMVEKHIKGFGTNDNKGGYYLLTNPVADVQQPSALGLLENNYDLYRFDQAQDLEWQNYKHNSFDLANGMGYLYANSADTDIAFSGVLNPANVDVSVPLTYDANAEFAGWNLVGNPFVCNAYLADGRDFFILDDDGKEVILSNITNSIAPMQGVFVQAAANESSVSFTTTASAKGRALNLSVTRNRGTVIDNARVRFDEGRSLEKFQLNPNHTKLYIPQDGKDYAVVNTEAQGELPFSFKAEESGIYTISVNFENVDVDYLHLIDNMTGVDIDLLINPSYTFEAKTTDYESRFKLVFSANNNDNDIEDENFAFVSDGNIIVFTDARSASLQVIDMLGRILLSRQVTSDFCLPTSVFSPGVYVLRLVNGSDVKTQKMVIE